MALPALAFFGLGMAGKYLFDKYEDSISRNRYDKMAEIVGQAPQRMQGPVQPGAQPPMSQGSGMLGGQMPPLQAATELMALGGAPQAVGAKIFDRQTTPWKPGSAFEIGMPGDQRQKVMWGPDNQLVPLGQPYKPGSAVTITNEAAPTPQALLEYDQVGDFVNEEGKNPVEMIGQPIASLAESGYHMKSTQGQKEDLAESKAVGILDVIEERLFGKDGIYNDWGTFTKESLNLDPESDLGILASKAEGAIKQNFQVLSGIDPRYRATSGFIAGTMAPLARAMGQVGSLSDTDLERIQKLSAQITGFNVDSPESAKQKLGDIRSILTRGERNIRRMSMENRRVYPNAPDIGEQRMDSQGIVRIYRGGDPNVGWPEDPINWEVLKDE